MSRNKVIRYLCASRTTVLRWLWCASHQRTAQITSNIKICKIFVFLVGVRELLSTQTKVLMSAWIRDKRRLLEEMLEHAWVMTLAHLSGRLLSLKLCCIGHVRSWTIWHSKEVLYRCSFQHWWLLTVRCRWQYTTHALQPSCITPLMHVCMYAYTHINTHMCVLVCLNVCICNVCVYFFCVLQWYNATHPHKHTCILFTSYMHTCAYGRLAKPRSSRLYKLADACPYHASRPILTVHVRNDCCICSCSTVCFCPDHVIGPERDWVATKRARLSAMSTWWAAPFIGITSRESCASARGAWRPCLQQREAHRGEVLASALLQDMASDSFFPITCAMYHVCPRSASICVMPYKYTRILVMLKEPAECVSNSYLPDVLI